MLTTLSACVEPGRPRGIGLVIPAHPALDPSKPGTGNPELAASGQGFQLQSQPGLLYAFGHSRHGMIHKAGLTGKLAVSRDCRMG